jgi:hypothetical protein
MMARFRCLAYRPDDDDIDEEFQVTTMKFAPSGFLSGLEGVTAEGHKFELETGKHSFQLLQMNGSKSDMNTEIFEKVPL